MDKTQPLDEYWIEVPDLTIYHAAFWMQLGGDPRTHEEQCELDDQYYDAYYQHPGGYEAVCARSDSLYSAIHLNLIKVTEKVLGSNGELDFKSTRILKSDWLNWCRTNGNPQTAKLADWFEIRSTTEMPPAQTLTEAGLTKRERQIRAIEAVADGIEYQRKAIPDGGKLTIKQECLSKHSDLFGAGDDPFKEAWQEAVTQGRIRMKGHEKYSKR
jgi:hypothetical protein